MTIKINILNLHRENRIEVFPTEKIYEDEIDFLIILRGNIQKK